MVDSKGVDPMQRSDAAGAQVVDAFGRRLPYSPNRIPSQAQCCRYCGAPLRTTRLGVRMTPLKAAILDKIKRAGGEGIAMADLIAAGLSDGCASPRTIKAHVYQINELLELEGSEYRIRSICRVYYLKRI